MNIDDHVVVIASWSQFLGRRGIVVMHDGMKKVLLEGETKPLFFGERAIAPASLPAHHAGAE